jgi:hypothetical protein
LNHPTQRPEVRQRRDGLIVCIQPSQRRSTTEGELHVRGGDRLQLHKLSSLVADERLRTIRPGLRLTDDDDPPCVVGDAVQQFIEQTSYDG